MKRAILIMLAIFAAQTATLARAETTSYTVVLAGGAELSMIHIWLTPDGRSYVIDSAAPLEVGGTVCEHSVGNPDELVCQAPLVAGFEVNAGPGDDSKRLYSCSGPPVWASSLMGSQVAIFQDRPENAEKAKLRSSQGLRRERRACKPSLLNSRLP